MEVRLCIGARRNYLVTSCCITLSFYKNEIVKSNARLKLHQDIRISLYPSYSTAFRCTFAFKVKGKVPTAPMVHRTAPISVSSSPRPHVCECSESYSGGLVYW